MLSDRQPNCRIQASTKVSGKTLSNYMDVYINFCTSNSKIGAKEINKQICKVQARIKRAIHRENKI